MIKIKRIYEDYSENDGYRILVDRLWPRGISKENARIDLWIKELTPSNELRKWYHDNSEKRDQFKKKYLKELEENSNSLHEIKTTLNEQKIITLLTASKDPKPIHAQVLELKLRA